METVALKAGPDLDHLIAEKVMGWQRGYEDDGRLYWATGKTAVPGDWSPSTNMLAAWEVVEKLGEELCVSVDNVGFEPAVYRVTVGWGDDPISGYGEAETAQLAICEAALEISDLWDK